MGRREDWEDWEDAGDSEEGEDAGDSEDEYTRTRLPSLPCLTLFRLPDFPISMRFLDPIGTSNRIARILDADRWCVGTPRD